MLPKNPGLQYREQQVYSASPLQRTLIVYDAAIMACNKRDLQRTTQALNLLRNTLDFEQGGEIATELYTLYQYCADLARGGRYDEAADILRSLVQAWVQVLVREAEARQASGPAQRLVSMAG